MDDKQKLKIEFWADYMCPLCYIGKTHLENAIIELQDKCTVEVIYRPFQLFPDAPVNTKRDYYEYTSMTHGGMPVVGVRAGNLKVVAMARSAGLNYDLDNLIPTNTTDALRITLYAQEQGKAKELSAKIYQAYLIKGQNIADIETLTELASQVGLGEQAIREILSCDKYKSEVKAWRSLGEKQGIKGTPFFVINKKYSISGVKTKVEILDILKKVSEIPQ